MIFRSLVTPLVLILKKAGLFSEAVYEGKGALRYLNLMGNFHPFEVTCFEADGNHRIVPVNPKNRRYALDLLIIEEECFGFEKRLNAFAKSEIVTLKEALEKSLGEQFCKSQKASGFCNYKIYLQHCRMDLENYRMDQLERSVLIIDENLTHGSMASVVEDLTHGSMTYQMGNAPASSLLFIPQTKYFHSIEGPPCYFYREFPKEFLKEFTGFFFTSVQSALGLAGAKVRKVSGVAEIDGVSFENQCVWQSLAIVTTGKEENFREVKGEILNFLNSKKDEIFSEKDALDILHFIRNGLDFGVSGDLLKKYRNLRGRKSDFLRDYFDLLARDDCGVNPVVIRKIFNYLKTVKNPPIEIFVVENREDHLVIHETPDAGVVAEVTEATENRQKFEKGEKKTFNGLLCVSDHCDAVLDFPTIFSYENQKVQLADGDVIQLNKRGTKFSSRVFDLTKIEKIEEIDESGEKL